MRVLSDYIHSKGLKAGIYSDAGSNTCGSIYDADTLGIGVGLWKHDDIDCQTFLKDWGYDFIKIDWCGGEATGQSEQQRYTDIYKAIRRTGRTDVRYNICRLAVSGHLGYPVGRFLANPYRHQSTIHNNRPNH